MASPRVSTCRLDLPRGEAAISSRVPNHTFEHTHYSLCIACPPTTQHYRRACAQLRAKRHRSPDTGPRPLLDPLAVLAQTGGVTRQLVSHVAAGGIRQQRAPRSNGGRPADLVVGQLQALFHNAVFGEERKQKAAIRHGEESAAAKQA